MIKYWILILGFMPLVNEAQTFEMGSWNLVNLKYNFNTNWSAFSEAQLRSLKFYNHFHYYEYKGGSKLCST